MSPPGDHDSRTPERRASSQALFSVFRNLTTGRLKSPTPPPSTSSATGTPVRTPSLGPVRPTSVASPHSIDGVLQGHSLVPLRKHAKSIVGGPPELDDLIAQLDSSNALPERLAAVDKICTILEEYPVQNILGLWAVASDLLLPEQLDDVVEAGYKLLGTCASLPKLVALERSVFFDAASLRKDHRCFEMRLQTIIAITKGGRDVEACESFIAPFILTALETCFNAARHASHANRKADGKRSINNPTPEAANLARLFNYVIDVCRFNAKMLTEGDLNMLLKRAVVICNETRQEDDMSNCIRLFDTVITYVHIPTNMLKPCLEVLCAIHRQIENLQEQTWNTLSNLFKSHVGGAAVSALLHTLLDGPTRKERQYSLYRGTIQVLQLLLLEDGRNGLPKVPMSSLFPALKASIKEPHLTHEGFVMSLVDAVLDSDDMRRLLTEEIDLSDLFDIVQICADRDDERLCSKAVNSDGDLINGKRDAAGEACITTSENSVGSKLQSVDGEFAVRIDSLIAPVAEHCPGYHRRTDDSISQILKKLDLLSDALDFVQKEAAMYLLLRLSHRLSDASIEKMVHYFQEEHCLNPGNGEWMNMFRVLVSSVIRDVARPRTLRILTIKILSQAYDIVEELCDSEHITQTADILLESLKVEDDIEVLSELVDFAVRIATRASFAEFSGIIQLLKIRLDRPRDVAASTSSSWPPKPFNATVEDGLGSSCNVIVTALVRLFIRCVTHAARKSRLLYDVLREVAGSEKYENDARLTALKLLFRLRADARHAVIVSASSEGETIAAELCRTEDTAILADKHDEQVQNDHVKSEDLSARKISGTSPHPSFIRLTARNSAPTGRVSKPIPPLWMYPGPKGLPEEPSTESSRVVFSHVDSEEYPLSSDILDMEITLWLELIISLLQKSPDWEIYSYVLVHLGPQLSNQALVRSCVVQLRMLRSVLCEQVRNSSFHEPPPHTLLKKADVAVCLFHILTVIISYHDYFEKSEEDDLVKSFLQGIVQWDRTSKWCIHALSVCCFEIPLSVSKSLDSIVQKMSQIITKPATAIHILEFLTSLARLPELLKNFREDEFKLVFGVCFRYLQHIRDQRERTTTAIAPHNSQRTPRHSGVPKEYSSPDRGATQVRTVEDDLPQYLYSLAYHVITFWFIALKMEDRPKQIPWITKNLCFTDSHGRQFMEEQGQVILDIMNMVAYTDRDQTTRDEGFAKPGDGEIWKKTWVVGHGLITIETAARTGASLITTRRPCGTRYLTTRPLLAPAPRHQVPITIGLASETYYSSSYIGILPDDIFQSFYAPLNLTSPPIPLPDDDMTRRAITSFDRIATVDSYKVGVIYIGEGQTDEREIFMNDMGSPAYTSFISDLGTLCRLKDAKFNTGGLDTREDVDGEFTYCWRDRCMELVFHITTMMPTNRDNDMTYPNKKRHIGNDFVNIIFNDSGLPYNFDTFPSAFNYVHIVITPESRASFVDRRLDADSDGRNRYYKVQAISKSGFPDISPAVETKILCGKHLAGYCRLIAINACVFSAVWFIREGGESISSWRNRLREIKRLRERYGAGDLPYFATMATTASPTSSSPAASHGLGSPPPRDHGAHAQQVSPLQRMSVTTFVTEGTSRSSVSSASHDQ